MVCDKEREFREREEMINEKIKKFREKQTRLAQTKIEDMMSKELQRENEKSDLKSRMKDKEMVRVFASRCFILNLVCAIRSGSSAEEV